MKLVGLSVLLSIALLTSTVYLLMHLSSRGQNLERSDQSDQPTDSCLFIDAYQGGSGYYQLIAAHSICPEPKKFKIVYNTYEGGPEKVFISNCQQYGENFFYTAYTVKSITHYDC